MATRLGKFELPNRLVKEEETSTDTYAKFIADPFESGYGHTIGNAFRRVLLSSIEGAAISSLKLEGVQHEFQSIDGVVEDVTDIVLNLKKVLVISHKADPVTLTIDVEKEGEVTAGDISPAEGIEIILELILPPPANGALAKLVIDVGVASTFAVVLVLQVKHLMSVYKVNNAKDLLAKLESNNPT